MEKANAGVLDELRALTATLCHLRGRFADLSADMPDDEPGVEGHEGSPGLRSVVSCVLTDSIDPAIRDLLCAAEQEAARPSEEGPAADSPRDPEKREYGALFKRLAANLPSFVAAAGQDHEQVEQLFSDLTSLRRDERVPATADSRFHRLDLVERLLEGAQAKLPSDPGLAEELGVCAPETGTENQLATLPQERRSMPWAGLGTPRIGVVFVLPRILLGVCAPETGTENQLATLPQERRSMP
jgi:hypothetical protein